MNLATDHLACTQALLDEFDLTSTVLAKCEQLLSVLRPRRDALEQELDAATRPVPLAPAERPIKKIPSLPRGYGYTGGFVKTWTGKDAYLGGLRTLLNDFPNKRAGMAAALARQGRNRTYLSQDRSSLFSGKSQAWILDHSVEILPGWFADKNLSGPQMAKLIQIAVKASDLPPDVGFIVRIYRETLKA